MFLNSFFIHTTYIQYTQYTQTLSEAVDVSFFNCLFYLFILLNQIVLYMFNQKCTLFLIFPILHSIRVGLYSHFTSLYSIPKFLFLAPMGPLLPKDTTQNTQTQHWPNVPGELLNVREWLDKTPWIPRSPMFPFWRYSLYYFLLVLTFNLP